MPDAAAHPSPTPGPASPSPSEARPTFPVEQARPLALPGTRASVSSRVLHCPTCGSNYDVRNWAPGLDVACPSCDVALIPPPTIGAIDAVEAISGPRRTGALEPQGLPFGRYQLLSELGRGGMGVVLKAWDTQLKRIVALKKILAAGDESQIQIERFMREARLAAKLRHPHIVGVLDVGVLEGQHYFTSEFIEGTSLFQLLKDATPQRQKVGWIRSIADALAYAHAQGVVHRDVKPENILIDAKGRPFITDFGLAKQVQVGDSWAQDVPSLTVSGALLGTPAYLSPEQASGRIEQITAASDQFALGVVLYQLLTQKLPFDEVGLRDQLNAVITKDPLAPSSANPSVHRDLDAIVLKSIEKDPKRRYADIGEMAADLGRWLDGEPIRARPASWLGRTWRKAKRNRAVTTLAAGLAVSTILGIGVVAWFAVIPRMREAAALRDLAEARAARSQRAAGQLAEAREALDAGRLDRAVEVALGVIRDGAPHAAQGEDLPIGEAHVVLGQAARAKGEPSRALAEFYRAFEASLGTSREAGSLVLVADQLAEMGETAQAARLFERALGAHSSPRDTWRARRGLALASLVEGRFDEARRRLARLGDSPEASGAERQERADLLDLLSTLAGTMCAPLPDESGGHEPVFAEFDGGGTAEGAAITADGKGVLWFLWGNGFTRTESVVGVLGEEPFALSHLAALDLDGDGKDELVVGGGRPDPPGGVLAVLSVREGKLVVVARASLASSLAGSPFAAADLDGDGAIELLVGTAVYERSLRVYRCDLARGSLDLRSQAPLGGDVAALLTRRTGNRAEVWAFAGAWSTFGAVVLEHDAATQGLVERERLPLAEDYRLDSTLFAEGGEVLLGLGWSEMAAASVPFTVGRKRFDAAYRAPGAWRVRRSDMGTLEAIPFESMRPGEAWGGTGHACVLRGKRETWAITSVPVASADGTSFPLGGARVWRRVGDAWAPLIRLSPAVSAAQLRSFDFDGDGEQELYAIEQDGAGRVRRLRIHGMGPEEDEAPAGGMGHADASVPRRSVPAALTLARETERVGLWDEAWDGYDRVLASPSTEEDAEEAALGLIRCGVAQGRFEMMALTVARAMDRFPTIARRVGRALVDALDDAGQWDLATQSLTRLGAAPDLSSDELAALLARGEILIGLASKEAAFDAAREIATCDLLATTPLAARIGEQGAIELFGCSRGVRQVLVPMSHDGTAWRLLANVEVPRHDWAIDVELGIAAGDPVTTLLGNPYAPREGCDDARAATIQSLWLASEGRTAHPNRFLDLVERTQRGARSMRLRSRIRLPLASTDLRLELAPHQRALRSGGVRMEGASPSEAQVFLVLGASGRVAVAEYAAEVHVRDLRIEAGRRGTRATAFVARRPAEYLLLANGRAIQGRVKEAREAYDTAIAFGDAEAAHEADLARQGLPGRGRGAAAEAQVPVDARLWRGLMRAEAGDAEGARADLLEAWAKDGERCKALMAESARPLRGSPAAVAALRAFLTEGRTVSSEELGREVFESLGFPLAEALLMGTGVRPVRRPRVRAVGQGSCGLVEGDVIETLEGRDVDGAIAFDAAIGEANNGGIERVVVRVMRGGAPVEVPLGLPGPKIETEDVVLFVADPNR